MSLSDLDWRIRLHIYQHFVAHGQAPTYAETAMAFDLSADATRDAYRRLHEAHALLLDPQTDTVRMANPLSAVPTAYRVRVAEQWLYANCAWDSLGIPAMLHADAEIQASFAHSGEPARYAIAGGRLKAGAGWVVHYPLPFRRWYDDLIHT